MSTTYGGYSAEELRVAGRVDLPTGEFTGVDLVAAYAHFGGLMRTALPALLDRIAALEAEVVVLREAACQCDAMLGFTCRFHGEGI